MDEYDFGAGDLAKKTAELKNRLSSLSTDPPPVPALTSTPEDQVPVDMSPIDLTDGANVDWTDYDLQPGYAHFYPKAHLIDSPSGERVWAVKIDQYHSVVKSFKEAGAYLTSNLNSDEGWKLTGLLPGSGVGIILQRKALTTLPDPLLISNATEATPTDAAAIAKAQAAWASGQVGAVEAAGMQVKEGVEKDVE